MANQPPFFIFFTNRFVLSGFARPPAFLSRLSWEIAIRVPSLHRASRASALPNYQPHAFFFCHRPRYLFFATSPPSETPPNWLPQHHRTSPTRQPPAGSKRTDCHRWRPRHSICISDLTTTSACVDALDHARIVTRSITLFIDPTYAKHTADSCLHPCLNHEQHGEHGRYGRSRRRPDEHDE